MPTVLRKLRERQAPDVQGSLAMQSFQFLTSIAWNAACVGQNVIP